MKANHMYVIQASHDDVKGGEITVSRTTHVWGEYEQMYSKRVPDLWMTQVFYNTLLKVWRKIPAPEIAE
jgi:hypothetical protein